MSELSEGDKCPWSDCDGVMEVPEVENCSCHISAPCSNHAEYSLQCTKCGWSIEDKVQCGRQ